MSPVTKSHLLVCKEKALPWRSLGLILKPSAVLLSYTHEAMVRWRKSAAWQQLSAHALDLQEMRGRSQSKGKACAPSFPHYKYWLLSKREIFCVKMLLDLPHAGILGVGRGTGHWS